jgi:signal transduction histidine kinase
VLRAVEGAKVAMETRGMTIDAELPEDLPVVWHDVDAVSQVVTNLLSNAAKYGQDAGWIGIRVQAIDDEVRVSVSDRGIGIAPQEQRLVFEQYYRSADPLAKRKKGTGIGLTIVKYIMEAHGGHVSVRSELGRGTTFTLHFPLKAPPPSVGAT